MSVKKSIWGILALLAFALFLTFPTEARGVDYVLGEDSQPQEGVPKGTVTTHTFEPSKIYPGTTHEYWVYVPAQYKESEPACVMVFQDGAGFVHKEGSVRA